MNNYRFHLTILFLCGVYISAFAQKGTGNPTGIARERINPEFIILTGIIKDIKDGPCEYGTGRSVSGTHLILEADNQAGTFNVHLGPTNEVSKIVKELTREQKIEIEAFRTNELAENHYIAKEINTENRHFELRDSNLRPFWAGRIRR